MGNPPHSLPRHGKGEERKNTNAGKIFETLCMKEYENIDSLFTHVIGLVTQIRSHGETLEERIIVEKVLRILPSRFDAIVVTI